MFYFISLIIAAGLGLIPAYIAKNKGYNFWLWWVYGWMLFIVAIIHVQFIPQKKPKESIFINSENKMSSEIIFEYLNEYKELFDKEILTEEEFNKIKQKALQFF